MKFTLPLSATLFALVTSTSVMAANLSIPMSFEYLALDGTEIETNMFSHKTDLELTDGSHKVAIRYSDMIEDDFSDSTSFIKSAPFIITINVDGDYEYQLSPADGEFVKRPKTFAKNPQVIISREGNGKVDYSVVQTDFEESTFISNLFNGNKGSDFDELAATATGTNVAPAAVTTTAIAVSSQASAASTNAVPVAAQSVNNPEQMLQYWWLQADEETRKEFMSWAIKQL